MNKKGLINFDIIKNKKGCHHFLLTAFLNELRKDIMYINLYILSLTGCRIEAVTPLKHFDRLCVTTSIGIVAN